MRVSLDMIELESLLFFSWAEVYNVRFPVLFVLCIPFFWLRFLIGYLYIAAEKGEEEMQARPVYVAAIDLSCKITSFL